MRVLAIATTSCGASRVRVSENGFPSFLPREVEKIRDPSARELAKRIERIPVKVGFSETSIMSSYGSRCRRKAWSPLFFFMVLTEWRYTYPLLENAGLETWAVDVLGWGFSDLEPLPACSVDAKREHLYQLWRSYIDRPMVLVGPSLGAAVAIDFAANYPEAVTKLVLIDASIYAKGTGNMSTLPRVVAYTGVSLLKSIPLRLYANFLAFNKGSLNTFFDWTNRLHDELPNSILHIIPECGHIPHVENPKFVVESIVQFVT
ncbi:hypothetical protein J5N97_015925 [Dioscorea zingiberensis]|uniref:AB hydrolase-1 domain-containing protein n=1 Tax=Dioscorea zingiberensis TaxID=325984 RepID=A0A9D5CL17_9LILI|nr:hypothetical protein J5N97_015925 [Dioscorea zingiberensis]